MPFPLAHFSEGEVGCLCAGCFLGAVSMLLLWINRPKPPPKRRTRGRYCHNCGYDLIASPDRCPECGAFRWPAETNRRG